MSSYWPENKYCILEQAFELKLVLWFIISYVSSLLLKTKWMVVVLLIFWKKETIRWFLFIIIIIIIIFIHCWVVQFWSWFCWRREGSWAKRAICWSFGWSTYKIRAWKYNLVFSYAEGIFHLLKKKGETVCKVKKKKKKF